MKKLTVPQLRNIIKQREAARVRFNKLDEKLRKNCHCPKTAMRTREDYSTDTLGSNGRTSYQDYCSLCGKYHGDSYSGEMDYQTGRMARARFKVVER